MDRRHFHKLLTLGGFASVLPGARAGAAAAGGLLYSAVGDRLTRYRVDIARGTLLRQEAVTLPSAIQYVWPQAGRRRLYAITSDAPGGSVGMGHLHRLVALSRDGEGRLTPLGEPAILAQRPIFNSVDASGRFVLVAYNNPAAVSVHRIQPDGSLGGQVAQPPGLDCGIFPHQLRSLPAGRSAVLVTRGNNASAAHPEDPGALKLFRFADGVLTPLETVRVGGHGGLGYGPRHLDFHPRLPLAYVALERENLLHTHRIDGDGFSPEPLAASSTLAQPSSATTQMAGAIFVHPHGHTLYVSNRASPTVDYAGQKVFAGGENTIAVFRIDPATGVPRLIQSMDARGYHVRSFAIDPTGRLLVAAAMVDMAVREGDAVRHVPAGLSAFRILADGRLEFLGREEVSLGGQSQMWVGMV